MLFFLVLDLEKLTRFFYPCQIIKRISRNQPQDRNLLRGRKSKVFELLNLCSIWRDQRLVKWWIFHPFSMLSSSEWQGWFYQIEEPWLWASFGNNLIFSPSNQGMSLNEHWLSQKCVWTHQVFSWNISQFPWMFQDWLTCLQIVCRHQAKMFMRSKLLGCLGLWYRLWVRWARIWINFNLVFYLQTESLL